MFDFMVMDAFIDARITELQLSGLVLPNSMRSVLRYTAWLSSGLQQHARRLWGGAKGENAMEIR